MKNAKKIVLYIVWACLYILCVGLGTLEEPAGFGKAVLVVIGLGFFVPGFWLAIENIKEKNRKSMGVLRIICICSLSLTLMAIVGNFLSAVASVTVGNTMYDVLALVSAPMLCIQYWALSIFLWACLLMVTIPGVVLPQKES